MAEPFATPAPDPSPEEKTMFKAFLAKFGDKRAIRHDAAINRLNEVLRELSA